MNDVVHHALSRLDVALTRLEAAVASRLAAERDPGERETELALMGEDRARLAAELDAASARLVMVEAAAADVGHRLGRAIGAVEGVLAGPRGHHHPEV